VSRVLVGGIGAVSPAGWGVKALRQAVSNTEPAPVREITRPGWDHPLLVRQVPPPQPRPNFLSHPRLRRCSPITRFAAAAAIEALGKDAAGVADGVLRLGIVSCVMSGCVNYSRRFYQEVLAEPTTASPLVFPETVFNAPASHIAALLGPVELNYTLVGDPGVFLQGLVVAAQWLASGAVDGCLVIGAEETDWITADSFRLFARRMTLSEGAGAVYLLRESAGPGAIELAAVTDSFLFTQSCNRNKAAKCARTQLPSTNQALLVDSTQDLPRYDRAENEAWADWKGQRIAPKTFLGEGLMATAAWQCVIGIDALQHGRAPSALISVVGCNQQAIGAHFVKRSP
jgi:3-oxoacyl-(acyl-carrier-protein) synthase